MVSGAIILNVLNVTISVCIKVLNRLTYVQDEKIYANTSQAAHIKPQDVTHYDCSYDCAAPSASAAAARGAPGGARIPSGRPRAAPSSVPPSYPSNREQGPAERDNRSCISGALSALQS